MEFADLTLNRKTVEVLGVPVVVRLHSVAFRNYSTLVSYEGRRVERWKEPAEDGTEKELTRIVDAGNMDQYRKIVRATIMDGVVTWGLKTKEGTCVLVSEEAMADLEAQHPEFLAELFDAIEEFNQELSKAKKKT